MASARVAESIREEPGAFCVAWPGGETRARNVLMATGASDIEPQMPHVEEALRDGVLRYCPVCDGYEAIDRDIGVLVAGQSGVEEAIYIRHFSDRVTVFPATAETRLSAAQRERLAGASVDVRDGAVSSLRLWDGRITVRHGDSETVCDTVYSALGMNVHSDLAIALGAAVDDCGYLLVDSHQRTSIAGIYAAGDVASGLNQISVAFGGAAIAASAIHRRLLSG